MTDKVQDRQSEVGLALSHELSADISHELSADISSELSSELGTKLSSEISLDELKPESKTRPKKHQGH
jgi:hypothetical protein